MAELKQVDVLKLSASYLTSEKIDDEISTSETAGQEEGGREQWTSGLDFFLASLGYAVGVGNVWRFPYLCYKNGGGTFLIPYFVFMFLIGIPMVYLEFSVGQFTSNSPLLSWKMIRICQGVGISANIANSLLLLFYNMIIAYSLYFLVLSFTTELPWQKCRSYSSPSKHKTALADMISSCLNPLFQPQGNLISLEVCLNSKNISFFD
jgi:SNF family Na+-dependent transporter